MTGRGAWNVAGVGGTKKYKDETKPGPYYFLGTGEGRPRDNNERAVKQAVRVYQRQLNARVKSRLLDVDGVFGSETLLSVLEFQDRFDDLTSWGGIGELTSEYLLRPYLKRFVRNHSDNIPAHVVSGLIRTESLWDVGAVGYQDDRDVGLGQINADAHPDMTFSQRIRPKFNFRFIINYLENSYEQLHDLDNAIASYNLGVGGVRTWIAAGRPNRWKPAGSSSYREVWDYINRIKNG